MVWRGGLNYVSVGFWMGDLRLRLDDELATPPDPPLWEVLSPETFSTIPRRITVSYNRSFSETT
jgi:hypothetical protein